MSSSCRSESGSSLAPRAVFAVAVVLGVASWLRGELCREQGRLEHARLLPFHHIRRGAGKQSKNDQHTAEGLTPRQRLTDRPRPSLVKDPDRARGQNYSYLLRPISAFSHAKCALIEI